MGPEPGCAGYSDASNDAAESEARLNQQPQDESEASTHPQQQAAEDRALRADCCPTMAAIAKMSGALELLKGAVMTVTAADQELRHRPAQPDETTRVEDAEVRCTTAPASSRGTRMCARQSEIQRAPTEELLPGLRIHTTVGTSAFHEE